MFVCGIYWIKWIVLVKIKVRGIIFEEVKIDIMKWYEDGNVSILGIFFLVYYLERKFFKFVKCVNIDFVEYEKV